MSDRNDSDLAVRFGEPAPSALIARRILDARILTVASPIYIGRHGRPSHPQDLASETHQCIRAIDTSTGRPFDWEVDALPLSAVRVHAVVLPAKETCSSRKRAWLLITAPVRRWHSKQWHMAMRE
jgi:hypothetical protein